MNVNKSSKGAGPLARPPKVLSLAPCGLTLLTSSFGICPAYNKDKSSLYAFAHPIYESATLMTVSV